MGHAARKVKEEHPLTRLIPKRADRSELAMDIAHNGLRKPVLLYEGKIIEGRVRYQAALDVDVEPRLRDWVLWTKGDKVDPLDWIVRKHVETYELSELDLVRLVAAILPYYRKMKGQTEKLIYEAIGRGLAWNRIRAIGWLEEAGALGPVLSGEQDVYEAARALGLASDKREIALGKSYGAGDKFDRAVLPLKRYLAAWKRKGYEFRHLNPKEASRRLSLIDSLIEELQAARIDLEKRAVSVSYSMPAERKVRP